MASLGHVACLEMDESKNITAGVGSQLKASSVW